MNRFAILGAMGVAVIVAALLLNYAINRDEVGDTNAPVAAATAPAGSSTPPSGTAGAASNAGTATTQAGTTGTQGGGSSGGSSSTAASGEGQASGTAGSAAGSAASAPAGQSETGGGSAAAGAGTQTASRTAEPAPPAASSGTAGESAASPPGATGPAAGTEANAAASGSGGAAGAGPAAAGAPEPPAVKPTFDIVRVNPDGGTVVAGRAAPHAVVTITADGQKLGAVTADERGEWVLVPDSKLAPGNHQIAISSQLGGGAPVPSDDLVVVVVPKPQVAGSQAEGAGGAQTASNQLPQQPLAVVVPRGDRGSTVLQSPNPPQSGQLVLQSVDYDVDGRIVIGGHAAADKEVRAYLDNRLLGAARADSSGRWHVKPEGSVPPGLHTLRIDEVDDSGRVLARVESPFSRAEPLTIAAGDQVVVVQPGNSLWLIATRTYGSGFRYTVIYQANKGQIKDPDLIYPGQVFKLPTTAMP